MLQLLHQTVESTPQNGKQVNIKNNRKSFKMEKLKCWLYTIAIMIFSALLIAYSYDIANDIEISKSSTKQATQDMLVSLARFLGISGSWIVGSLATGASLFLCIQKYRNKIKP